MMSYSRSQQYYEQSSRSRSRDRKYRREYKEEGERYVSSYRNYDYSGSSSGRYERRAPRQPPYVTSQRNDPSSTPSSVVLAVFNISIYTTEAELYDVFSKFGPVKKATVVLDAKTGRSRGFGFVYFDSVEDAKVAHAQSNGIEIGDRRIRVDFSATQKPHDPTPGVYYGKVSYPKGSSYGPPAPVSNNMGAPVSSSGGYYHCRACEIEARERERWERETRRYNNGDQYYYQEKYATHDSRPRDRAAMPRSRSEYYRGGANIR
ncbi:transformer-2 protein homolog alpha-like [Topomyia yanbarensis]|uniref:transformer-2 protein homolog alpha-like n=1 Tax=Topomyia yanbarensis TaxID=2498891 RepID=UPI00273AB04D|nr:transformer-2 protein homolog alpha-like [Topomyia yanbarensis]XP_058833103.1 transformer-2 protein homolog alpha-like [Topomyia yanbarensis]